MQLYHNARLKHRHKELKNLWWSSLLIYEEHLFIINSMWNIGHGGGKEGVSESPLGPQAA